MKRNILLPKIKSSLKIIILSLFMLFVSFAQVFGQKTWDGGAGTLSWTDANNWNPNAIPVAGDVVAFNAQTLAIINVPTVSISKLQLTNNSYITLRPQNTANRTLTVTSASNDAILLEAGSTLLITGIDAATDRTLTLTTANTVGLQANIDGTIIVGLHNNQVNAAGAFTKGGTNATILINANATYQHDRNAGAIPTATWDANSNCNITGVTSTIPTTTSFNQSFGHFTWNCTGQTASLSLAGNLRTINGNFTVSSTGSTGIAELRLSSGTAATLAVAGNFTMSSGTLNFNSGTGTFTMNVAGNFTHSGGTITETSTGAGSIVFSGTYSGGTGMQTFTSGGTVSNTINFTVNDGAYLQLAEESTIVSGGGSFTLSSGVRLGITSPDGITTTGATGNIRVTGTRSFNTGANYIYNGTSAQNTGNGLPSPVSNLTFDNSGGAVTFNSSRTITNNFTITSGSVANLGTFTHSASDLKLGSQGTVSGSWGSSSSAATNKNDTYFAVTTGIINVISNTCTAPSAPTTTGDQICVGTTTGTTLSTSGATVGQVYKWYSASSGGTLLKTSTNNTDNTYTTPVLSATTSYWVAVQNTGGCESARTEVIATLPSISPDDQNQAGTNSWIGHVYDGTNFNTYYGSYTETELFDQSFGGDLSCFSINSTLGSRTIYAQTFSVRYRMNSTKKGLYVVDLGSDDGSRLSVDGTLLFNNWTDQAFSSRPRVLMGLNGASSLVYDFNENGGQNRVVFLNLTLVLANNLSNNVTQNICPGNTGNAISGDVYGTLPTGISLSGTGYQWTYSTTPGGTRVNITGATGATFTPNTSTAPFNSPETYYVYRNAVLVSSNNTGVTNYIATNESNAATITVNDKPSITAISAPAALCAGGFLNPTEPTVTANGSTITAQGWQLETAVGGGTFANLTVSYTVTYADNGKKIRYFATNTCGTTNSNEVTLTVRPEFTAGAILTDGETICINGDPGVIGSSTAASGGDGTITYEWRANGTPIASANSATYDPPSGLTATTTFTRWAKDNTCNTTFTQSTGSWVVTVPTIPDFDATIIDATCPTSADGSIEITNPVPVQFNNPDYIDIGSNLLSNRNAFTLEGWIKVNLSDIGTRISLFGQNDVIEFGFMSSTSLMCWTASGGSVSANNIYPSDNGWHHVAAVGNGTNIILYIDGAQVATGGNVTGNYGNNTSYSSKIGAGVWDPTGGYFPGQMLKVGFWNTALNASQISNLASGFYQYTGFETGLIAGYNFFEGTGTTLGSVITGTDGIFNGTPTWTDIYTYSWTKTGEPGFSATTKNLFAVSSGVYNLTVANGICTHEKSFTVNSTLPAFTAGAIATTGETICSGDDPGEIGSSTSASGGDNSITYEWRANGTPLASTNSATYDPPSGLTTTTTYTRWAKDGTCNTIFTQSAGSWVVTVNPLPTASIASNNSPVCAGDNATFTLVGTSGATVTYNINGGSNATVTLSGGTDTVTIIAATASQTLNLVSVADANCSQILSESSTVIVNPLPATGEIIPD